MSGSVSVLKSGLGNGLLSAANQNQFSLPGNINFQYFPDRRNTNRLNYSFPANFNPENANFNPENANFNPENQNFKPGNESLDDGNSYEQESLEKVVDDLLKSKIADPKSMETSVRPQEKWKNEIDNGYGPFIPIITEKPNARVPLDEVIVKARAARNKKDQISSGDPSLQNFNIGFLKPPDPMSLTSYPHPYQYELTNFELTPQHLAPTPKQIYKKLEETKCTWISTVPLLEGLISILSSVTEFAVDLEHHSTRSYHGFTCLMQISTRDEDFLVDCIELRTSLSKLNVVFTDPKIVKVFHGADKDIEWLQHDLGIYVVNMFDTGQASRVLEFQQYSLSYLLKLFCNLDVDKKYQLADWRIRPLTAEMKKYAQGDTHYLLYIYDCLRNQALEIGNEGTSILGIIWLRSRDICLIKYENPDITTEGYITLLSKFNSSRFTEAQFAVFAALFEWRDSTARSDDESVNYVLPNHTLFDIACKLPTDVNSLLACCEDPISPYVKQQAPILCHLISVLKLNPYGKSIPTCQFYSEVEDYSTYLPVDAPVYKKINPHLLSPYPNFSTNFPSPVLSTEQLYRVALWTDESARIHNPKGILSNEDTSLEASSIFSLFRVRQEGTSDDKDQPDEEGVMSARRTAREIARSWFISPMKAAKQAFAVGESIEVKPLPLNLSKFDPNKDEDESSDEQGKKETDKEVSLEDIPKTMEEIYRLSNKTRVQKKEKKKLKRKISTAPASPILIKSGIGNLRSDFNSINPKKGSEDSPEDPEQCMEFMKLIGWVEGSENLYTLSKDQFPPLPSHNCAYLAPAESKLNIKSSQMQLNESNYSKPSNSYESNYSKPNNPHESSLKPNNPYESNYLKPNNSHESNYPKSNHSYDSHYPKPTYPYDSNHSKNNSFGGRRGYNGVSGRGGMGRRGGSNVRGRAAPARRGY